MQSRQFDGFAKQKPKGKKMKKDLLKKAISSKTAQDLCFYFVIPSAVFIGLSFGCKALGDKCAKEDKIVYEEHMRIKAEIKEYDQQPTRNHDSEYYRLQYMDEVLDKKHGDYRLMRNEILQEYKKRNR